jgi:hypothetical protein
MEGATMTDYSSQIAAGIEWLNAEHPDWREKDYSDLNMHSAKTCMLSKNGGYWTVTAQHGEQWSVDHGFRVPDDMGRFDYRELYTPLTKQWLAAMKSE